MPTLLFVPFEEKDQAKALGARWDPNNKTWYIPDHLDPSLFQKWLTPEGITEPTIISDEFYLLDSTQECWKCGQKTPVTAILVPIGTQILELDENNHQLHWETIDFHSILSYITYLNQEITTKLENIRPYFQYTFSRTTQGKYWANLCQHCHALQGDFHLHSEPDGAFGFLDDEKAQYITA